jgi:hypothetical protein
MPLVPYSLRLVRDVLAACDADPNRTGMVLTLSHPDVIATPEEVEGVFGDRVRGRLPFREGEIQGILNWHKAHHLTRLVDTPGLFRLLGYEMTAVDLTEGRGGEVRHDLNTPIPTTWHGAFDLVYDLISNQVFDVARCMANAALACRVGGHVLHTIPVAMVNQGFYGVSPTTYRDFYEANGFTVIRALIVDGVYHSKGLAEAHRWHRVRGLPEDAMNVVQARKDEARGEIVYPVLYKFRRHPDCRRYD